MTAMMCSAAMRSQRCASPNEIQSPNEILSPGRAEEQVGCAMEMARVSSAGCSACKCSPRRRPLPRRSARARRTAGVGRGAPLMAVVPEGRRDRVELSLGGAGGLLRASRATMCWFGGYDPNASPRLVAIAIAILC